MQQPIHWPTPVRLCLSVLLDPNCNDSDLPIVLLAAYMRTCTTSLARLPVRKETPTSYTRARSGIQGSHTDPSSILDPWSVNGVVSVQYSSPWSRGRVWVPEVEGCKYLGSHSSFSNDPTGWPVTQARLFGDLEANTCGAASGWSVSVDLEPALLLVTDRQTDSHICEKDSESHLPLPLVLC